MKKLIQRWFDLVLLIFLLSKKAFERDWNRPQGPWGSHGGSSILLAWWMQYWVMLIKGTGLLTDVDSGDIYVIDGMNKFIKRQFYPTDCESDVDSRNWVLQPVFPRRKELSSYIYSNNSLTKLILFISCLPLSIILCCLVWDCLETVCLETVCLETCNAVM